MKIFDWYYRDDPASGRMERIRLAPSDMSAVERGHRRVRGERSDDDGCLVFRGVRGSTTYADLAIARRSLPLVPLRSFLADGLGATPMERMSIAPDPAWTSFVARLTRAEAFDPRNAQRWVDRMLDAGPDHRLGTATLVPDENGHVDALFGRSTTPVGAAGRVVGELLEIHSLNVLFKPRPQLDSGDDLRELVQLVSDPRDIRRTWAAHLARTLESNPAQGRNHVRAIDLAESTLLALWDARGSSDSERWWSKAIPSEVRR